MSASILTASFFDRDAQEVARDLLGKVIHVNQAGQWLQVQIIETEAYYRREKASHASLGYTEKRKALFMPPGTIYMYYARGGPSFNISCRGAGNAVLIKAGVPWGKDRKMITTMQKLNPTSRGKERPKERLCAGQTLLCRSLGLTVEKWDKKTFHPQQFYLADMGYRPQRIIQTRRLGIPPGRDEHLPYRFIDYDYAPFCTENPLTKRNYREGADYHIITLD
jgi:DNA-3-methyladenine glycosylase